MTSAKPQRGFIMPLGVLIMKDDSGAIFEPRQGYRKYAMTNQTYRTQYLVVCSADRIENLLYSLVHAYFPKNVYGIIEFFSLQEKDKSEVETYLSTSLDRDDILAVFKSYIFQLLNDGQIAFGIAWQEGNQHEEIFVDDHKIITVMTSQELVVNRYWLMPASRRCLILSLSANMPTAIST